MSAFCVIDQVPATVGNLCTGCVTKLHTTVLQVPRLLVDLDVTITKQARQSVAGGASNERPLVLNLAASEAAGQVRMWLRAIAHLTVVRGEPVPVEMRELAAWTARRLSVAARNSEIADYSSGLLSAVADGWRAVDRAPERRVVGTCDCGGLLVTSRSEGEVQCRQCQVLWDITDCEDMRREKLMGKRVATSDLVRIFRRVLGVNLKTPTVRKWVERGQIRPVSVDPVMFLVGDAVATWEQLHGPLPGRKKQEVPETV